MDHNKNEDGRNGAGKYEATSAKGAPRAARSTLTAVLGAFLGTEERVELTRLAAEKSFNGHESTVGISYTPIKKYLQLCIEKNYIKCGG